MEKISYIEALRFIATCAVVLMHTSSAFYTSLPDTTPLTAFHLYHYIGFFAVPVFVMISGALFLSPQRDTSYRNLFGKYVRRIALALLVFGLPMCLLESKFEHQTVFDACLNFLRGHSWTHMWYLYMIICLYLLTPVLKPFVLHQNSRTVGFGLFILFLLSSLLPSLVNYGIEIDSWMIISTPFIFYYILGYYLAMMEKMGIGLLPLTILLLLFLGITLFRATLPDSIPSYNDITVVMGASALFLLLKRLAVNWSIANRLAPYCFAIYLIHPVFINIFRKVLHIDLINYGDPCYIVPIVFFIIFNLSLIISYLLRLIPFMRRYVI